MRRASVCDDEVEGYRILCEIPDGLPDPCASSPDETVFSGTVPTIQWTG